MLLRVYASPLRVYGECPIKAWYHLFRHTRLTRSSRPSTRSYTRKFKDTFTLSQDSKRKVASYLFAIESWSSKYPTSPEHWCVRGREFAPFASTADASSPFRETQAELPNKLDLATRHWTLASHMNRKLPLHADWSGKSSVTTHSEVKRLKPGDDEAKPEETHRGHGTRCDH